MKFKFPRIKSTVDKKVAKIDMWYDRSWRSWGIAPYNKSGDQLDNAIWVHSKKEAMDVKNDLKQLIGKEVYY